MDTLVHYYSRRKKKRWTRTLRNFKANVTIEFGLEGCVGTEYYSGPRFRFLRAATRGELMIAAGIPSGLRGDGTRGRRRARAG